jgi:glutamyl-tRNA reductase
MIDRFHIIAFTHRNLDVSEVGLLHIDEQVQKQQLTRVKESLAIEEIVFLSTCNRVEFLMYTESFVSEDYTQLFLSHLYPHLPKETIHKYSHTAELFHGEGAVEHLLSVASSIDSMVIGEREIITQVRQSFERCREMGLTGDFIRLVMRHTIETAKRVYTETSIANKPVSVVSLAYHRLRDLHIPLSARFIIVGAGVTNTNMCRFLKKHGYKNFSVFNRTLSKAEALAVELNGQAYPLEELGKFDGGFDVLLTCTSSTDYIITSRMYEYLLKGETTRKVVIDLALPQDLEPCIKEKYNLTHISIEWLQKISNDNLKERSREIDHVEEILTEAMFEFRQIHRIRVIELAMRIVPEKVKEIRQKAVNAVFKKEIEALDDPSKELLDKIIGYMEKKYMSVPMLMAKDILLQNEYGAHSDRIKGK